MGIVNHAEPVAVRTLRAADVVFSIGSLTPDGWQLSLLVHSGLCIEDQTYSHGEDCHVAHIDEFIERDVWGKCHGKYVVDISGEYSDLDDISRAAIVHHALKYCDMPRHPKAKSQYYMGPPSPDRYPGHAPPGYAFTCATFVAECYKAGLPDGFDIVDATVCPFVTEAELKVFREEWGARHVAPGPFRRVLPAYLIAAFACEKYPFRPEDWEEWATVRRYLQTPVLEVPSGQAK